MKTRKIVALVLCASMMMGVFAGCSKVNKVNNKKMEKAANKLDIDVIDDVDDMDDVDPEDGVLLTLDKDALEDLLEDVDSDDIDEVIDVLNDYLDTDMEFDIDEIEEVSLFAYGDGEENMAIVAYIDIGNDELAGQLFNGIVDMQDDVNDFIEDVADEYDVDALEDFEFNLKKFSKDEYYFNGKNKGYLKFGTNKDDLIETMEEFLDEYGSDLGASKSDIKDAKKSLKKEIKFETAGFGIYFNGSSIVVTFIFAEDDDFINDYETFMKTIGLDSVTKQKLSDYSKELILPVGLVSFANIASYIAKAQYAASQVEAHNSEIDKVVAEIEANS
ncbi:MAG: hypothetical protein MJ108_00545 [Saccharofermentans sp.]|nr:hypothetical protein [Saccharofermentans sp.]